MACDSCDPCKDCQYGNEDEACGQCDPCSSSETCSWCGNHFCRCDTMIEDTEGFGVMHPSCAELERAAFRQTRRQ
jgi:hypothetical protein